MPKHVIDWAQTAKDWAAEVEALEETEGKDSRDTGLQCRTCAPPSATSKLSRTRKPSETTTRR